MTILLHFCVWIGINWSNAIEINCKSKQKWGYMGQWLFLTLFAAKHSGIAFSAVKMCDLTLDFSQRNVSNVTVCLLEQPLHDDDTFKILFS